MNKTKENKITDVLEQYNIHHINLKDMTFILWGSGDYEYCYEHFIYLIGLYGNPKGLIPNKLKNRL